MRILRRSAIYENPLPQLCSRQSTFPYLCALRDGSVLAAHVLGEAFESVDAATHLSLSRDGGATFSPPQPLFSQNQGLKAHSESCKVTRLKDGRLAALGNAFDRSDPSLPLGNPENGGLLDDRIFLSLSRDDGASWSPWKLIDCAWGPHVEVSSPLYELGSGTWVTPITGFADWNGKHSGRNCGRLLRSDDQGETWSDEAVCMAFPNDTVTCYEQRLCQLESGKLVCIGWNEDLVSGERLENHYTVSLDDGRTFSAPRGTGVRGQASSVCAIGGEKLLALHAVRRDTERPGVYAYIVNCEHGWEILDSCLLWAPNAPQAADRNMSEIFSHLHFGQPSAIAYGPNQALCCHWYREDGQYKTVATLLALD